jgi:DNA end-binding protein Ku
MAMASTIWKGYLTFGLVSIPVKLHRAARAEKVSFRQLHRADHSRVRQTYVRDEPPDWPAMDDEDEAPPSPLTTPSAARMAPDDRTAAVRAIVPASRELGWSVPPAPAPEAISRDNVVKGFEYEPDRYVVVTKDDLAKITAATSREMQILEFVQLTEIDPIYFETSYYIVPDRAGERPYALLLEALRQTAFVAIAQLAMHNREHVVVIRPGRTGMILHTMFYEDEIRRTDEYRVDISAVNPRELELATRLISALAAPFDPTKYKDTYREKLDRLIAAKVAGDESYEAPKPKAADVVNIMDALQRSLSMAEPKAGARKPAAVQVEQKQTRKVRKKG